MIVHTKNSIYSIEVGEGFEVRFIRNSGRPGVFGSEFIGEHWYGKVETWPPRIGDRLIIRRGSHDWPVDESKLITTYIMSIHVPVPEEPNT